MTPWNAATQFMTSRSGTRPSAGDASMSVDPSASFDPARTGDPSPDTHGRSDLEVGSTGGAGWAGQPGRNPIGFAPPTDPDRGLPRETSFRTEISFKRHNAPTSPVASSLRDGGSDEENNEAGSDELVWQLPVHETEDRGRVEEEPADVLSFSTEDAEVEAGHEAHDEPAAEETTTLGEPVENTVGKVPFYKRELSFRRRKSEPEAEVAVVSAVDEPAIEDAVTAETVAEEPVFLEPVAEEPVADEIFAEESAGDEPTSDEHVRDLGEDDLEIVPVGGMPVVDDLEYDEPEAEVTDVEVPLAEEPVAEAPVAEAPVAEEPVAEEPIAEAPADSRKRGGRSIGRKRNGSPAAASAARMGRGGRSKKFVGLKIGASQLAAAVVVQNEDGHELLQLARRPIDSGLVVDGEIRDAEALSHELKVFFEENKLPKKDVRIGLASNRIGVRTLEIAGIDDEDKFDNVVRFKAHEVLPVAQHESVLEYRILDERLTKDNEPSRRVLLVVAPRDQVEPYVNVAQMAGIRLAGLDLEALSLLRAFVDPKPFALRAVDDTSTVIVSIGHENTTLLVSGGGTCEFTRVFDWGGGALQEAVMQELDVHHAEAATILRHLSFSGPGRLYDGLDDAARAKALEAVRPRLIPFARELVSSLQFYQTQPDSLGIGEIVITGGTSHFEGLAEALHQMIGVTVRVGDPLTRVRVTGEIDSAIEATIGSMAVPIGLAIEDEATRSVNLLPTDLKTATHKRPSLVAIALPVAVAVPVVALGFMFVSAHGKVSDSQAQLDAVTAQLAALPKPHGPVIDASIQGAQAQRAQAVANVLGGRVAWDEVLRDVSRVLPGNVWLSSLEAKVVAAPVAGATPVAAASLPPGVSAAPTGALIDGYTYHQTDVARLLARLATLPTLSNVTLTSSKVETKGAKSVVHFQIAADLNTGGS